LPIAYFGAKCFRTNYYKQIPKNGLDLKSFSMQKSIGLLLILAAFALGYFGFKNLNEKTAELKIGDVEVTAKTSESKGKGYAFLAGGGLCLIAGTILVSRKTKN
jgi:hypothetical protein